MPAPVVRQGLVITLRDGGDGLLSVEGARHQSCGVVAWVEHEAQVCCCFLMHGAFDVGVVVEG